MTHRIRTTFFLAAALTALSHSPAATCAGTEPGSLAPKEFDELHAFLKPQSGESRWMEIDWHPSVWEGRRIAAAQGKPLFLWAGSGGAPAAGC